MRQLDESRISELDPASLACLSRTRSAVLNVLVAIGIMIAVSGGVLRLRAAGEMAARPSALVHRLFMTALVVLGVASYLSRRVMGRRPALADPSRRERQFFRSHVVPALLAAAAAPLGLACGWLVAPQLDVVIPFWVVPLALGFLSLPRARELADFEQPMASAGASQG